MTSEKTSERVYICSEPGSPAGRVFVCLLGAGCWAMGLVSQELIAWGSTLGLLFAVLSGSSRSFVVSSGAVSRATEEFSWCGVPIYRREFASGHNVSINATNKRGVFAVASEGQQVRHVKIQSDDELITLQLLLARKPLDVDESVRLRPRSVFYDVASATLLLVVLVTFVPLVVTGEHVVIQAMAGSLLALTSLLCASHGEHVVRAESGGIEIRYVMMFGGFHQLEGKRITVTESMLPLQLRTVDGWRALTSSDGTTVLPSDSALLKAMLHAHYRQSDEE